MRNKILTFLMVLLIVPLVQGALKTDRLNVTGNITSPLYCNATNCFPISDFVNQSQYAAGDGNITVDNTLSTITIANLLLGQFQNNLNWITNTVSNLVNYYTKTRVDDLIANNITSVNASIKIYIDAQDVVFNDSLKTYVDDKDTLIDNKINSIGNWTQDQIDYSNNSVLNLGYYNQSSTDIRVNSIVNTTEETIQNWITTNKTDTETVLRDNIDTNKTDSDNEDISIRASIITNSTADKSYTDTRVNSIVNITDNTSLVRRTETAYYNSTNVNASIDSKLLGDYWFFTVNYTASGTMDGNINLTQDYDDYDSNSMNITGATVIYYANTSSVIPTNVNEICLRYKADKDTFELSLYDTDLAWESYLSLVPLPSFTWICADIRDSTHHIVDDKILMRILGSGLGTPSASRKIYIDSMYVSSGYTPIVGNEVDPIWNSNKPSYQTRADTATNLTNYQKTVGAWTIINYTSKSPYGNSNFTGQYYGISSRYNTVNHSAEQHTDVRTSITNNITAVNASMKIYVDAQSASAGNSTDDIWQAISNETWTGANVSMKVYVDDSLTSYEKIIDAFKQVNFTTMYYAITSRFDSSNFTTEYTTRNPFSNTNYTNLGPYLDSNFTANYNGISSRYDSSNFTSDYAASSHPIQSGGWTNTSTQTTITLNVGIGDVSPDYLLDVERAARTTAFNPAIASTWVDVKINNPTDTLNAAIGYSCSVDATSSDNAGMACVKADAATATTDLAFVVDKAGASPIEAMRLRNDGNVGIGNIDPNSTLQVSGDINSSGNVSFNGLNIVKLNTTHWRIFG